MQLRIVRGTGWGLNRDLSGCTAVKRVGLTLRRYYAGGSYTLRAEEEQGAWVGKEW